MNINELLSVIENTISSVTWTRQPEPGPDAVGYFGRSDSGWLMTVIEYTVDAKQHYDGAAVKKGVIVHLTPGLAENAFRHAQKNTSPV